MRLRGIATRTKGLPLVIALVADGVFAAGPAPVVPKQQQGGDGPGAARWVVLGENGRGAEGAEVRVLRQDTTGSSPMAAVLVEAETASGGEVRSRVPRLPGLVVVIDHPEHLPFVVLYGDEPPPSTFRLEAGTSIGGAVIANETGVPVPGAHVCASWVDEGAPERVRRWERCADSDESGRFRIAGLPSSGFKVVASARGFEALTRSLSGAEPRIVLALDRVDPVLLALETGTAGRVLAEVIGADGEPVPSFTMRVEAVTQGRRSGMAVTVEQQFVPATASIPARYLEGDLVAVTFEAENHLRSPMTSVSLLPGGEVDLGAVFLRSGAVVRGRIFDAVGAEPTAGCLVELLATGAGEIRATLLGVRPLTVSGEDGSYLLGGLSEGRYHLREVCYGTPTLDRLVVLDASEHLDLGETWLHQGRRVLVVVEGVRDGTVRALDRFREVGTPIAETVLAPSGRPGGDSESVALSAVAELLLAPGEYRFEALDVGGSLRVSQEVVVGSDGPGDAQRVSLRARSRTIRSVLTMDGFPVYGGSVALGAVLDANRSTGTIVINSQAGSAAPRSQVFRAGGPSFRAQVDANGVFEVTGAPADILWMTWFDTDGSSLGRLWPEGALAQLDLGGTRVGGILLDRDGRPVRGELGLIGDLGREVATTSAGPDGRFTLPPATPGRYLLRGRTAGRETASVQIELTTEEPLPQVLRIPDTEAGRIELSLRRPSGNAAAGAWVHVLDTAAEVIGTGLSSERGRLSRGGVRAGDVSLVWNDGAACVGARRFTLDEGETLRSDLTLTTGRLLELQCPVEECAGVPLSFLSVRTESGVEIAGHLSGATGGPLFSDAGTLGLGCVTPDSYELSFWAAGQRWSGEVDVDPVGAEEGPVTVRGRPAGL